MALYWVSLSWVISYRKNKKSLHLFSHTEPVSSDHVLIHFGEHFPIVWTGTIQGASTCASRCQSNVASVCILRYLASIGAGTRWPEGLFTVRLTRTDWVDLIDVANTFRRYLKVWTWVLRAMLTIWLLVALVLSASRDLALVTLCCKHSVQKSSRVSCSLYFIVI